MKFSIGTKKKKYRHDTSYNINTTSDFGSFQPILCQYLSPNDSYNVKNFRQLVRNAVMPNPTFGAITCVNKYRFVPMSEIFPQFDALISGKDINSYVVNYKPTEVPTITNSYLVFMLSLLFGRLTGVRFDSVVETNDHLGGFPVESITFKNVSNSLSFEDFLSFFVAKGLQFNDDKSKSCETFFGNGISSALSSTLNFNNSDFVLRDREHFLFIRLSSAGKRLYKVFKGLGYSLDPNSQNKVSILPLFAYYKAYFDAFYPTRHKGWQNTWCFELINTIFEQNLQFLNINDSKSGFSYHSLILNFFLHELSECWYTYSDDYVSANQVKPLENAQADVNFAKFGTDGIPGGDLETDGSENIPALKEGSKVTQVALDTLGRITRFMNKNSLIGNRIKEYVRVHYGEDTVNDMFEDSNDVATFTTDITVDDMYSSSDTLSSDGRTGEPLGKRGGRGDGYSDSNSFKFKANKFGFIIGFTAIYPQNYYFQGDDAQLYMTSRFMFPESTFDSLGYELTPLATIYDNSGLAIDDSDNLSNKSFGYLPRYSMFKTKKNLVNGDMRLRSTRDSFLSFYLDRYIQLKEVYQESDDVAKIVRNDIPDAGVSWRFNLRYPQLCFPNRIFLNSGNTAEEDLRFSRLDDNFTIQCRVSAEVINSLKPLSQSFDTFDTDVDNTTTSTSNV